MKYTFHETPEAAKLLCQPILEHPDTFEIQQRHDRVMK